MPDQTSLNVPRFLDYPYSVSGNGTPSTTLADDHLRDLILQVLFTNPGERVNLPEFGAGCIGLSSLRTAMRCVPARNSSSPPICSAGWGTASASEPGKSHQRPRRGGDGNPRDHLHHQADVAAAARRGGGLTDGDASLQSELPRPAAPRAGIRRWRWRMGTARLLVTFFDPIALPDENFLLQAASYSLTGGRRIFPRVLQRRVDRDQSAGRDRSSRSHADVEGDFSVYTLTVGGPGIDPFFAARPVRFRLACEDRFDCRAAPAPPAPEPELPVTIDYLSKDYAGFRQALLDSSPPGSPPGPSAARPISA